MSAVLRPNPPMPSDAQLIRIFDDAGNTGIEGVRALWRAGCDAGMVAPLSTPPVDDTEWEYREWGGLVRRRKAGPWLPVDDSTKGEEQ